MAHRCLTLRLPNTRGHQLPYSRHAGGAGAWLGNVSLFSLGPSTGSCLVRLKWKLVPAGRRRNSPGISRPIGKVSWMGDPVRSLCHIFFIGYTTSSSSLPGITLLQSTLFNQIKLLYSNLIVEHLELSEWEEPWSYFVYECHLLSSCCSEKDRLLTLGAQRNNSKQQLVTQKHLLLKIPNLFSQSRSEHFIFTKHKA